MFIDLFSLSLYSVFFTNREHKAAAGNVVYSMTIYSMLIRIVTEQATDKSTIVIDVESKTAMLDDEPLAANAVDWLFRQCQRIAADISAGRVAVYESIQS